MPIAASKINPCLWFDTEAEEAARFYCSIFKNSKVGTISRYGSEGKKFDIAALKRAYAGQN